MKPLVPMRRFTLCAIVGLVCLNLGACQPVDVTLLPPDFGTTADTTRWAAIPAGDFNRGQFDQVTAVDHDYEMMAYLVTNQQYADYLNEALAAGEVRMEPGKIVGPYPGDQFHGARHEVRIDAGEYLLVPQGDASLRMKYDGARFIAAAVWEMHPMTMVSWFGARAYCDHYGWRLPTELEWEKAARGPLEGPDSNRPFPWGDAITFANANYYSSRDPYEDMSSVGSRTTPVGFYNGRTYGSFVTLDSPSPYGLYDMVGNVWQWTADVYPNEHYRYLRGGSKDTYDMDLRVWVRNSATPVYASPGVGFRCAR